MRRNEGDAENLFSGWFTFQKITTAEVVQSSHSAGLGDMTYRCPALLRLHAARFNLSGICVIEVTHVWHSECSVMLYVLPLTFQSAIKLQPIMYNEVVIVQML